MSSKKEIKFELAIPQNKDIKDNLDNAKNERIKLLKTNIKEQYEEVYKNQEVEITESNKQIIEDLILATKDLIDNCIKDSHYSGNRDENFVNLTYLCHKLDLKLETYKLEGKIKEIEQKSIKLDNIQNDIKIRQDKMEEQSNNLIYNLLGFLTAFSIVSSVIGVISKINGIINIMLFMSFTMLLLLTTLIALHNFYGNNKSKNILQNNYFLWIIVAIIIIVLIIVSIITTSINNKGRIYNYFDQKTENVIKNIVTEKINKEIS